MRTSAVVYGVVATMITLARAGRIDHMNINLEREIDREFAALYPRAASANFQLFTGSLGNAAPDPITTTGDSTHPFSVGGQTFNKLEDAAHQSCSNQKNACAAIANGPGGGGGGGGKNVPAGAVTVNACDQQNTACVAATQSISGLTLKTQDTDNLVFCDS